MFVVLEHELCVKRGFFSEFFFSLFIEADRQSKFPLFTILLIQFNIENVLQLRNYF